MNDYALDTHVLIWLTRGEDKLGTASRRKFQDATEAGGTLFVPAIVIWELGLLAAKGRISLTKPPTAWVEEALAPDWIALAPLTPEIALEANDLPGTFHANPADRLIVATARVLGLALATRDANIIEYASYGHVRAAPV